MLGGKPIFQGTSTMNQLDQIIEFTGKPSEEDIEAINSPFASTMLESLPPSQPRSVAERYPDAPEEAHDLLKKMLVFNPNKRISAKKALKHPYMAQFHEEGDDHVCSGPIRVGMDDDTKFSTTDYRNQLYSDIKKRQEDRKKKREDRKAKRKEGKKSSSKNPSTGGTTKKEGKEKRTASKKKREGQD
eukprot:TRINITY_DN14836_c0_g1_i1.p1 TRINITY_DN14836_c0_g1~~TRINITY_DN14836_c0_g1_i1.p1  ORF type:complete len:187 (-),score=48.04 TRINITY_DN14836_c0_g1_i1:39-599(-)